MDKKQLGRRINSARKDQGMTSDKLAEACHINPTYLRQIGSGMKTPSLPLFIEICRALKVSPNYMLPDLVPGSEAEKLEKFEKIFLAADPTPRQIEALEEMARIVMKGSFDK